MQQNNKIKILCTRPLPGQLIKTGEDKGFQIDVIPFIRTETIKSMSLKQSIRDLSLKQETVIFTSMNAAEAVIKELNGVKPLWTLFCIGSTTRDTLVQYFGEEAIAGFASNASKLAHAIIKTGNVQKAVFFCGDQRRDELPMILSEKQIEVQELIVYKTIPVGNKLTEKYEGILFFSPSAVTSFFSHNTVNKDTVLFAIGDTTAGAIKKFAGNTIVVSKGTGKETMVKTMIAFYDERKIEKAFN
jgi:uroporphyrinogen-III synthase